MLYELLGFKDKEFTPGLGWHDQISEGFSQNAVWSLSRFLQVPPEETAALAGMPAGTLIWKSRKSLLSPAISSVLFRLALATHRLQAVLKDPLVVAEWLKTPRPELSGSTPVVLLLSHPGSTEVFAWIDRIKPPKSVARNVPEESSSEDSAPEGGDDRADEDSRQEL